MKDDQKIRFCAPQYIVRSMKVDLRRMPGSAGIQDPLFRGRAERLQGGEFVPEDSILVDFANCRPEIEDVKHFLGRHGPLFELGPDGSFALLLAQFVSQQQHFRYTWDRVLGLEASAEPFISLEQVVGKPSHAYNEVPVAGVIEYRPTGLVHHSQMLYPAIVFKLFSLAQRRRLRRCLNPGCTQLKYFVADHPKSRYCSDVCAAWAQAQAKLSWWETKGNDWRKHHSNEARRRVRK